MIRVMIILSWRTLRHPPTSILLIRDILHMPFLSCPARDGIRPLVAQILSSSPGVGTWWTNIFQNLDLHTDAFALSFYHTLAQIPGMMLATCLIDTVGRRRLIIAGFGGGSFTLILLSAMANAANDAGSRSPASVLALACSYTVCLCVCWLALDCTSAESFPTRVRGTGRGVCVATGRAAGFSVQFLYGPLVNGDGLCRMMGLASAFAFCGMMIASSTTDTTNVDLRDHWDYSSSTTAESSSVGGSTVSRSEGDGASLDRLGELFYMHFCHGL